MSIQQRIASDVYRMADKAITPDQIKALQAHLVKSVQSGAVPSYVGVPLLNDLNQKMARIQTAPAQAQAMVQQPPIAQQVVGQAEQDQGQGVATLPSGLPEEGMAGGGIVAFSDGGMSDSEIAANLLSDEDDEEDDFVKQIVGEFQRAEQQNAARRESGVPVASLGGLEALRGKESFSVKEEGQPAKTTSREVESVRKPGGVDDLLKMIEQKESGGRRYDKAGNLLTSPKGAMGEMQVMPGTVRDPGFGVAPARDQSPDEIARVGRDYFKALLNKYGDPKVAAIAYNWGPGNTDKWLTAGADMGRLPAETRQYVKGFAGGGIVAFRDRGLVDEEDYLTIPNMYQGDTYARALRKAKGIPEEETTPRYTPGKMPPDFGMRIAREDLYGVPGLVAGTPYADAMARIPKPEGPAPAGPKGPSIADTLFADAAAKEQSRKNVMSQLSESEYGRQMGNVGGFFGDIGKGILGGIGTLGKHLVSAPGYGLSGLSDTQTPTAGAGRGTMPASSYNVPAAQAATQRPSMTQEAAAAEPTAPLGPIDLGFGADKYAPDEEAAAAATTAAKGEAGGEEGGIRSILDKYRQNVSKQREIDAYLSLLSAGLGMMGGTSPYGLANIGRGGQQGVATYAQLGAQRGADERALLGAETGLEKYKLLGDIRKQQMEQLKGSKAEELEIKRARAKLAEDELDNKKLTEIRRLAQQKALAEHKGELLPEDKERVLARAELSLLSDPAYRMLYERVYGFGLGSTKGGKTTIQFGDLMKK